MLSFMLHITVKPGCEKEALETLCAIQQDAHQDEGCINFVWMQHKDKPYMFSMFEQWENETDLEAHKAKNPARWEAFLPCLYGDPVSEEFNLVMDMEEAMTTQLTANEVDRFVRSWFDKLNRHVDLFKILPMVADENLEMIFPETTLHNHAEFAHWYTNVGNQYTNQNHDIEELVIDAADPAKVSLTVVWDADILTDGQVSGHIKARATQDWILDRSFANGGAAMIVKYKVKTFEELPAA